jgi:uncharacterized protein (TIGR00255 family)
MIKSMTGFGNCTIASNEGSFVTDIKSINSKSLDLAQKIPSFCKEKESEVRFLVSKYLERGKIDLNITAENLQTGVDNVIDKQKAGAFFLELKSLSQELGVNLDGKECLKLVLTMPEVLASSKNTVSEPLWEKIQDSIEKACQQVDKSRREEGAVLEKDFLLRIDFIEQYLEKITDIEQNRTDTIRNRIQKQLNEWGENFDKNRMEQEVLYYMERMDFTEEKVRLKKHCQYFIETVKGESPNGKKLTFISQEIGREVNTLGSKAYDADIQKWVVQMKDELEKIKEQLSNVL